MQPPPPIGVDINCYMDTERRRRPPVACIVWKWPLVGRTRTATLPAPALSLPLIRRLASENVLIYLRFGDNELAANDETSIKGLRS